jgi:hypothetical protein
MLGLVVLVAVPVAVAVPVREVVTVEVLEAVTRALLLWVTLLVVLRVAASDRDCVVVALVLGQVLLVEDTLGLAPPLMLGVAVEVADCVLVREMLGEVEEDRHSVGEVDTLGLMRELPVAPTVPVGVLLSLLLGVAVAVELWLRLCVGLPEKVALGHLLPLPVGLPLKVTVALALALPLRLHLKLRLAPPVAPAEGEGLRSPPLPLALALARARAEPLASTMVRVGLLPGDLLSLWLGEMLLLADTTTCAWLPETAGLAERAGLRLVLPRGLTLGERLALALLLCTLALGVAERLAQAQGVAVGLGVPARTLPVRVTLAVLEGLPRLLRVRLRVTLGVVVEVALGHTLPVTARTDGVLTRLPLPPARLAVTLGLALLLGPLLPLGHTVAERVALGVTVCVWLGVVVLEWDRERVRVGLPVLLLLLLPQALAVREAAVTGEGVACPAGEGVACPAGEGVACPAGEGLAAAEGVPPLPPARLLLPLGLRLLQGLGETDTVEEVERVPERVPLGLLLRVPLRV